MARASALFHWPVAARPAVRLAGLFPLSDRGFAHVYRSTTHALHLHDYRGTIRLEGRDHALRPGVVTVSLAGGASAYDLIEPGTHWCIHFDPAAASASGARSLRLPLLRDVGDRQAEAMQRFAHVARQLELDPAVAAVAASVALQDLLLWLATFDAPSPAAVSARPDPVDQVRDLIQRELHRPLSVPELARRVQRSQNYLARQFKRRTGQTIPHFILRRRIQTARLLLTITDLPVKQIAVRVGMADPHHFNKQFRRLVGCSPTAARRRRAL